MLEQRVVPAVNVAFTGGVLTLNGSSSSETVTVRAGASYTDVLVAGRFTSRIAGATSNNLSTINFTGGGGTDSLAVSGVTLGLTVGLTDVGKLTLNARDTNVTANTGVSFGVSTVTGTLNVNAAGAITQFGKLIVSGETTLTATGGSDITLSTSGNSFGTLVLNAANTTLNETGATDLGTISTGNLTVTSSGAITDSGNLLITGNTSLTSSGSTITLDQLGSSFGGSTKTVSLKGTNLSIRDTNATGTAFGTTKATGTLDVIAAGDVTQSGGVTVTGLATIAAGAGTKQILLNSATLTNNFGSLALTGTTVSITERSATDLAAVTASTLTVTANSSITDSDTLVVSGVTSLTTTGGSITLDEIASTFGSTVTLKGRNVAIIDNDGATELGSGTKANGTLAVTTTGTTGVAANDKVTQNGAISSLSRTTITASGKDITLNTAGNKFGSISVFGKNVDLQEADASDLFTSEVTGTFKLISGGGVTDSGEVSITGTTEISTAATNKSITLDFATSEFTGALTLSAPKNIAITNVLATNLATVTATTGTLSVTSGGDVTDSGVLTVGNRAIITAVGRDITLDSANNYGSVAFEGRNVTLTESSATDIYTSSATGTFSLTSTGAITDSGTVEVFGNMTLIAETAANAADRNITLDSASSTFAGNVQLRGAAVSVRDSDALGVSLGNSTVSGLLTITAAGDIADSAATAVTAATATFNAGTGDITLTKTTLNAALKTLRLTGQDASVTMTTAVDLGTTVLGGNFYLKTGGAVTQSGTVTVAGTTTIDADPPGVLFDITLGMSGNSFSGTLILTGDDVFVRNNTDTSLGNVHTHATFTIIANGNITNVLLPGPTYGVLDIDGATTLNAGTNTITLDILNSHSDLSVLPTLTYGTLVLTVPTANITLASSITADDIINIAESGSSIPISGTVGGNIANGDIVTLTINGATYTGAVASGAFSINVNGSGLAADADQTIDASVVTTGYGVYNATATDTETYQVDIAAPTVTVNIVDSLLFDGDTSSTVLFTFSEAVTGFTSADVTSSNGTVTGFTMTNSSNYFATFSVADDLEANGSVSVTASSYTDIAGNSGSGGSDTVTIDTKNPTVTNVTVNDTLLTDADVGTDKLVVTIDFSEAMNTGVPPTLTFGTSVTGTLTFNSGSWIDSDTYVAKYNVADNNVTLSNVTIDVTGTLDAAGNAQQNYTEQSEFSVDTQNPTVIVNIVDASLNDTDNSSNVTFTFSESTADFTVSDLTVGGGTLSGFSGSGTSYSVTFTANDNTETTGSVAVNASSYTDASGNLGATGSDTVTIDTKNPTVISFDDGDADNAVLINAVLTYTVTFSEDIDATSVTAADFENGGSASISIGTPTETAAGSGVFTVQVTPTSAGSLILQIKMGAVITDAVSNTLNTTTAIPDDTTVTVS